MQEQCAPFAGWRKSALFYYRSTGTHISTALFIDGPLHLIEYGNIGIQFRFCSETLLFTNIRRNDPPKRQNLQCNPPYMYSNFKAHFLYPPITTHCNCQYDEILTTSSGITSSTVRCWCKSFSMISIRPVCEEIIASSYSSLTGYQTVMLHPRSGRDVRIRWTSIRIYFKRHTPSHLGQGA